MSKFLRSLTLIALPALTLALGMHLGTRFEQQKMSEEYKVMEEIMGGGTGSGTVVEDPEKEVDITLLWS
ncbi:hypothetical protein FJZ28_00005, partial [Candidatus Peregrinibacteria bacterium]|nr:hypothetical protein [Candidatus Peregrinibacteria bacterium]